MSPPANRVHVAPASKAAPSAAAGQRGGQRPVGDVGHAADAEERLVAPCQRSDARADRVGPQEREPLAVLREVRGQRLGRGGLDEPRRVGRPVRPRRPRGSRPSRPTRARARRSACSSRRARRRPPCAWWPWRSSGTGSPARSRRASGGPGVAAGADGEALGDAATAGRRARGRGGRRPGRRCAGAAPPPAAGGRGRPCRSRSPPPVMGSAMAMARRPRTSRSGPRFTARMLPADRRTPRPGGRTGRREMR